MVKHSKSRDLLLQKGLRRYFGLFVKRIEGDSGMKLCVTSYTKDKKGKLVKTLNLLPKAYIGSKSDNKRPNETIHVNVSSVFYLGPIERLVDSTGSSDIVKYFQSVARRQLGTHVLVNRKGRLLTVETQLFKHLPKKSKRNVKNFTYRCTKPADIVAIHPSIRKEGEEKTLNLLIGLDYSPFAEVWVKNKEKEMSVPSKKWGSDEHPIGFRAYHRKESDRHPLFCGGVYELTEERFYCQYLKANKSAKPLEENKCQFAVYMCAGARLLCEDHYQEDENSGTHNRCLIEQGAVVIGSGQLQLAIPCVSQVKDSYGECEDKYQLILNFNDFCAEYLVNYKRSVKNPVLFLGANESDYNSICWKLSVNRLLEKGKTVIDRQFVLTVPEGGYVVAVEEWVAGIDEIFGRHQYEQLHRSITRLAAVDSLENYWTYNQFKAPDDELLLKILDFNRNRVMSFDILRNGILKKNHRPKAPADMHKEFNFYQFVGSGQSLDENKSKIPVVPPAYPPVLYEGQLYYLPQALDITGQHYTLDPVFNAYKLYKNVIPFGKDLMFTKTIAFKLSQQPFTCDEYHWERIECSKHRPVYQSSERPVRNVNDLNYRLGVDGCYYRRVLNADLKAEVIGKVKTYCYEYCATSAVNNDQGKRRI